MTEQYFEASDKKGDIYIEIVIRLSEEKVSFKRKIYGILELFGDIGGLVEFVLFAFSLILSPIAQHFYYAKGIKSCTLSNQKTLI